MIEEDQNLDLKREIEKVEMDDEIQTFLKVWITIISCLCYCYYIAARIPKGLLRLLSLLPIFYLFLILPLSLSSIHLCGLTTFFLVWLGTFKLFLFSFNQGPLALCPNISQFVSVASLPIKLKRPPPSKPTENNTTKPLHHSTPNTQKPQIYHFFSSPLLPYLKALVLAMIIRAYDYRENLHPDLIYALYICHVYLLTELVFALSAAPARAIFGFEIEAQFKDPYFTTSLQDFWGYRWNLMVSSILRPTVYDPVRRVCNRFMGPTCATQTARWITFSVSGLMHDVVFYYLTRAPPTWEVTWYMVVQGTFTVAEVEVKKAMLRRGWRLHRAVAGPLVLAFVGVTGKWLYFPQLVRNGVDRKAHREYKVLVDFVKSKLPSHFAMLTKFQDMVLTKKD